MRVIDLTKVLKGYTSGWVALSSDYEKVVGHGKTLREALNKAYKKRAKKPVVMQASKSYGPFAPIV